MAQDLVKRLNDAEWQGELESLTEIAESLFTHVCNAKGEAAAEKEKNMVLMREIQRLEQENGNLRTEMVDTEERYWKAHEEVDKAKKTLHDLVGQIAALVEENRKMKRELAEFSGGQGSGRPTDATNACECPKCGSADTVFVTVCGEEGLQKCNVCDTHYEVE